MYKKDRELKDIRADLDFITSNKLSLTQSKLLFMGITYEIILRKDLFPQNEKLKPFIEEVYVVRFADKEPFKDYLYDSRTLLSSRIQRKIFSDLSYADIIEITNIINNILQKNLTKENNKRNKNKKIKTNDDYAIEWMKSISDKKEE